MQGRSVTVDLVAGVNRVVHRLGREIAGLWVLVAIKDKSLIHTDVFPSVTPATDPQNAVNLTATVAATVTLWFF